MHQISYFVFLFLVLIHAQCPPSLQAQVIIEDPIVDVRPEWSNHKIENIFYCKDAVFARLDDSSLWKVNPNDVPWIAENEKSIQGMAFTLMPEAGTDQYPVKIIVHNEKGRPWRDFTVSLDTPPETQEGAQIRDVAAIDEEHYRICIQKLSKEGLQEAFISINPLDSEAVKNWMQGQRIIIGGTWFPEYDPFGRKDFDSIYFYTIYNYHTKEFAFFTF